MLSVIIPVKNEATFLPNCLKSVKFADEIIVLDSGSTDTSTNLAKAAGARVIKYTWKGFSYAHNLGARKAKGDWLLYLDADERISRKLRTEIQKQLNHPQESAYQIPRKNYIMGNFLHHGGWYPDLVTRLIKKSSLSSWIGNLHEYPQITGKTSQLNGEIYHLTHRGTRWMLEKTISYTHIQAQLLNTHGHPKVKVKNFFGAMWREFYFRAIKKSGWRDGLIGWLEIIYQTFNAFLIQMWLWEIQHLGDVDQEYQKIDQKISREL